MENRWMLLFGILIGGAVTIDPYFYYQYLPQETDLGNLGKIWWFPFLPPLLIVTMPFLLRFLYHRAKALTRLQWDCFLWFIFISSMFVNYWVWLHVQVNLMIIVTGIFLLFIRGALAGRFDVIILPIDVYFSILTLFLLLSVYGIAGGPAETMGYVMDFVTGTFVPIIFLHNVIRTKRQLMQTARYMIYITVFSSILAIIQYIAFKFFSYDMTFNWTLKVGRIQYVPIFGAYSRCAALSANSNYLGFSTGTITVFMTYLLVKPHVFLSRTVKKYLLIAVILGLFCSLFSGSRGSWLAMGVSYVVIPFMAFPKYAKHYLLALLVFAFLGWVTGLFEYMYGLIYEMREEAVNVRERLMAVGLSATLAHPWIGIGFGAISDYWNPDDGEVHNMWINFSAQIGIPGMLLIMIYLLSVIYRLGRAILRTSGFDKIILESLLVSMMFFIVNSTVRPMIWGKFFWLYFGFIEAAIYLLYRVRGKVKVYYPIFGYSWKEEPSVQLGKGNRETEGSSS